MEAATPYGKPPIPQGAPTDISSLLPPPSLPTAILLITYSRSAVHDARALKRSDLTVCHPGANLCGMAYGLVIRDTSVTICYEFHQWYESTVRPRLKAGAVELL